MSRLHCFLFGVLFGAVSIFAGMKYHFVRAEDGWHAIPKISNQLGGVYVDIRDFTADDWNEHRNLTLAIVHSEREYLLTNSATDSLRRSAQTALQSLGRARKSE